MVAIPKTSFTSGEVSPALHGRFDVSRYDSALAKAQNVFVRPHGGVSNRAGTEFAAEVKASEHPARVVPFTFNDRETYVLELGHQSMRVVQNGGRVMQEAITITGVTQASPVVLTAVAHGLSNGDELFLDGFTGMTELNSLVIVVANATSDTFELNTKAGTPLDGTGFTAHAGTGQASLVYETATPWDAADLRELNYVQSADVLYVAHPSYPPHKISRLGHTEWTVEPVDFTVNVPAPTGVSVAPSGLVAWETGKKVLVGEPRSSDGKLYLSASDGTTGTTAPTHTSGTETDGAIDWTHADDLTDYQYRVTAINEASNEESLSSDAGSGLNDLVTNGAKNTITWNEVPGANRYVIYREDNGVYGRIGSTEELTFTDQNITPDISDSFPVERNPFPDAGNFPACVDLYEQRLMFAATDNRPRTIFMSRVNAFENFSTRDPFQDDDAITLTIANSRMNRVRHMIDAGGDLLALTSGSEWTIKNGKDTDALTPTSVIVKSQSNFGAGVPTPLVIGKSILFPESKGKAVRSLGYEFASDGYNGQDVSILSDHLLEGREIIEWCYAQAPDGIVWAILDDGQCLALTLKKEHEVNGWTRMVTDGEVESVCSVTEGRYDVIYLLVKRIIDGRTARFIERMSERVVDDVRDAFFVDCGLSYSGAPRGDFRIPHLRGKEVAVLADGHVVTGLTVADTQRGEISLPEPASTVCIGLPYAAEIETLPAEFQTETGTPMGKRKRIKSAIIRVRDTRGVRFGPKDTELVEFVATAAENWDDPVQGFTGTIDQEIAPIWDRGGALVVRQDQPLPMTILGLSLDVELGE